LADAKPHRIIEYCPQLIMHRDLTDDEIAHFREHGWLVARRLIDPEVARQLAPVGEQALREFDYKPLSGNVQNAFKLLDNSGHELARSVAFNAGAGRNCMRLLRGVRQVRLMGTNFISKYEGNAGTDYHQDFPGHPIDRSEMLTIWIALCDITTDMGALRFVDRSHRYGALGLSLQRPGDGTLSVHPWLLQESKLTEQLSLAPGDATIHHGLTVHGADTNNTDLPRLAHAALYCDAAALYTGEHLVKRYAAFDLKLRQPMDHPEMPVLPAS
jgi:hypothetical protein